MKLLWSIVLFITFGFALMDYTMWIRSNTNLLHPLVDIIMMFILFYLHAIWAVYVFTNDALKRYQEKIIKFIKNRADYYRNDDSIRGFESRETARALDVIVKVLPGP